MEEPTKTKLRRLGRAASEMAEDKLRLDPMEDETPTRRWLPRTSSAIVLVLIIVLVAVGVAIVKNRAPAHIETDSIGRTGSAAGTNTASKSGAASKEGSQDPAATGEIEESVLVVHVVGAVIKPGLVKLPAQARMIDAITAAGGPTPEAYLERINLARKILDGEQLVVPGPGVDLAGFNGGQGEAGGANSNVGANSNADVNSNQGAVGNLSNGPINLNQANAQILQEIKGIGPALAERIIDYRDKNGAFHEVEDLVQVPGIGPAILERVKGKVIV